MIFRIQDKKELRDMCMGKERKKGTHYKNLHKTRTNLDKIFKK